MYGKCLSSENLRGVPCRSKMKDIQARSKSGNKNIVPHLYSAALELKTITASLCIVSESKVPEV